MLRKTNKLRTRQEMNDLLLSVFKSHRQQPIDRTPGIFDQIMKTVHTDYTRASSSSPNRFRFIELDRFEEEKIIASYETEDLV
ncbi:hypothetical protein CEXT_350461 [Caerostris extrusa]|uniref:Uncharacterized protein n=1 Tax=Caerostris extrusa TaxID=172846 RepID=A0AAV4Y1X4_CAEEX|nr:hypothetical protein CEXT_350461 [Caerostris extrusa]